VYAYSTSTRPRPGDLPLTPVLLNVLSQFASVGGRRCGELRPHQESDARDFCEMQYFYNLYMPFHRFRLAVSFTARILGMSKVRGKAQATHWGQIHRNSIS
jgi:hypothetical protein